MCAESSKRGRKIPLPQSLFVVPTQRHSFASLLSDDSVSRAHNQAGAGTLLIAQIVRALSINSRFWSIRWNGSVCVNNSRLKCRYLFVIAVYAPTEGNRPETKDGLCRGSSRNVISTDIVIIAADFTVRLSYIAKTERHIGCPFSVPNDRICNDSRFI